MASRRKDGWRFDHGAVALRATDDAFAAFLATAHDSLPVRPALCSYRELFDLTTEQGLAPSIHQPQCPKTIDPFGL